MRAICFNFVIMSAGLLSTMQKEEAAGSLHHQSLRPTEPVIPQTAAYQVGGLEAGLNVSHLSKELQVISTKPRPPSYSSVGWSQKNHPPPSLDPALYWPRNKLNTKTPATKSRKTFGWGDFYLGVRTAKLSLLLTGKLVDHVNGTFSLYFRHNSSRLGNLSVSVAPPSRPADWEVLESAPDSQNPPADREFRFWNPAQQPGSSRRHLHHDQQQETVTALNCRLEYQRTSRAKRTQPCRYDPSQTCDSEHSQSHSAWLCSKPCKVLCILISFSGTDYRLVQKVCPDYNYQDHSQHFG